FSPRRSGCSRRLKAPAFIRLRRCFAETSQISARQERPNTKRNCQEAFDTSPFSSPRSRWRGRVKRTRATDSAGVGLISSENLFGLPTLSYRPPRLKTADGGPHPAALCACTVPDQL